MILVALVVGILLVCGATAKTVGIVMLSLTSVVLLINFLYKMMNG